MDLKIESIGNAVKAAEKLGMTSVPWGWIKFLQSGWHIQPASCSCGGNWAWWKPRPSGGMAMYGCVCHHKIDLSQLLDTKIDSFSSLTKKSLQKMKPGKEDVGKIFYTYLGSEDGAIISRENFLELDPVEIGWWVEIDEFDIF